MSSILSFSMPTSIIIEATDAVVQSVLTVDSSTSSSPPVAIFTSPTPPVAIFTSGSPTGSIPEFTNPTTTGPSSSGMGIGAKAGVGVGVVVGVLVLAALLWFAHTMGKRRSRVGPSNPPEYDGVIHEEGKHSKASLYSVDSSVPIEKASAIDKAHNTENPYAGDAKVC